LVNVINVGTFDYLIKLGSEGCNVETRHLLLQSLSLMEVVELKPLNIIYWSRVGFGVVAALICVLLIDVKEATNPLISGMSIGILVYIISYYILKWRFMAKVENPSKVFTMGIGAYFLTWIVAWGLFYTLMSH